MLPDVPQGSCSEKGIADCVEQRVRIGVAGKAEFKRDLHSTQD